MDFQAKIFLYNVIFYQLLMLFKFWKFLTFPFKDIYPIYFRGDAYS